MMFKWKSWTSKDEDFNFHSDKYVIVETDDEGNSIKIKYDYPVYTVTVDDFK